MTRSKGLLVCAALCAPLLTAPPASAASLAVVNVAAPAINCVYNTACTIVVNDSIGSFTPPGDTGTGRVQSRTSPAVAGAPASGKMAYIYRVDMTPVSAGTSTNCVTKLQVNFGSVDKEPYGPGALFDVYVVTSGGLGSVALASATKSGSRITFNFAGEGVCPGATSYFIGLTSKATTPQAGTAKLFYSTGSPEMTADRVP